MNEALERINNESSAEAESMFRECCGSARWASLMAAARPFVSEKELMKAAATIWHQLQTADWLEAFSAHPKIGEMKAAPTQGERSAIWSAGEQDGMKVANDLLKEELAVANNAYYEKFGFIFIVCATGKSGGEMLELCSSRLGNDRETEIAIAAAEQEKITGIRLGKLLSQ